MKRRIAELISEKFSGEWGAEGSPNTGVKVIRTANFTNEGIIDFENIVYRDISSKKIEAKRLRKGDIIIEKSGGSPTQPVGRVVYFDLETDDIFLCNNFTSVLRPNRNVVNAKYLFYRLFEAHKEGRTLKYQNKTTGIINLKLEDYLNDTLDIPQNIEDQIRIATILGKVESLIRMRKESLNLLDEFLTNTFLEIFGNPAKNDRGWPIKNIRTVCEKFSDGPFGSNLKTEHYRDNGVRVVRLNNIGVGEFIDEDKVYVSNEHFENLKKHACRPGDVLIGTLGDPNLRACILPEYISEAINKADCILCRPKKDEVLPIYVSYLLNSRSFVQSVLRLVLGQTRGRISMGRLATVDIPVPPLTVQTQFASIVEKAEAIKASYESSLRELTNLYRSLSHQTLMDGLNLSEVEIDPELHQPSSETTEHPGIEKMNAWLKSYHENLPDTGAPKDIDIKIRQLDTELRIRQEIPFWKEYVKYRIVKPHFNAHFDFDNLLSELSKFPFEELPEYNTLKEMVFEWLTGERPFLKQTFNEESNKIVLFVNEATSS
jgi:type I restriction enzyme S subunit